MKEITKIFTSFCTLKLHKESSFKLIYFLVDVYHPTSPVLSLDLAKENVTSIIWATGYERDFGWIKLDVFNGNNTPIHERGVTKVPGLYFLGLAWLSRRASPFIWGVWHDASHLADVISAKSKSSVAAE